MNGNSNALLGTFFVRVAKTRANELRPLAEKIRADIARMSKRISKPAQLALAQEALQIVERAMSRMGVVA